MGLFLHSSTRKLTIQKSWVVCIVQEKVSQAQPSHTAVMCQHGWNSLLMMSRNRSTSWPRKVSVHHRLVSSFVIPMVLHRSDTSLATRSSGSSSQRDSPPSFQKICTILSGRLLP